MPLSPYCHFERKREIFFVRGQAKDVRIAASGKHRAPSESEGRCFMQTALRRKTETGNEKDPSAALGSPFQGKGLAWLLSPSRGRRENAAFPILSFRAKVRNLFRLRSGKGCEDSGELEAPCFQRIGRTVFHADSITKKNGNGKRKRSLGCARDDETRKRLFPFLFNLLRKPTPPRCARQPLPKEGGAPKGRRLDGESGIPDTKPSPRGEGGEWSEPDRVLAV